MRMQPLNIWIVDDIGMNLLLRGHPKDLLGTAWESKSFNLRSKTWTNAKSNSRPGWTCPDSDLHLLFWYDLFLPWNSQCSISSFPEFPFQWFQCLYFLSSDGRNQGDLAAPWTFSQPAPEISSEKSDTCDHRGLSSEASRVVRHVRLSSWIAFLWSCLCGNTV